MSATTAPASREILDVIKVLIATPQIAARVPVTLDFYLLGDRSGILNNDPLYERSLSLSRRVLSALSYAAGISNSLWHYQSGQKDLSEAQEQPQSRAVPEADNNPNKIEPRPADEHDKSAPESSNQEGAQSLSATKT